jgi:hypothetical protein
MYEVNAKKVVRLASIMSGMLEWSKRNDGTKFVRVKDGVDKMGHWVYDVVRAANGDGWLDDTVFEFAWEAASTLSECDETDDEETLRERIYEMEPDVYTHDLTEWLNRRPDHTYYLTQAQEEFGAITDGFQLLGTAQKIQMDEVGMAVLQALNDVDDDEWMETHTYVVISQVGVWKGDYANYYTLPEKTRLELEALAEKHGADFDEEEEFYMEDVVNKHDWFDRDEDIDFEVKQTIAIRITIKSME